VSAQESQDIEGSAAGPPDPTGIAAVIVLAAGGGKRMKSKRSKLLHEVAGRPLVDHAIRAAESLRPEHMAVVVGVMADQVVPVLSQVAPEVRIVTQSDDAYGTGHAVRCAMNELPGLTGEVVVTYGDVPMLTAATLRRLVDQHRAETNAITVLTARVPNPAGYGRIIRDALGEVLRIVEHKDATEQERLVDEINSGIFVFDAAVLRDGLNHLTADNAQGEYYLTDLPGYVHHHGLRIGAWVTEDLWETEGVNTRVQLAAMNAEMNRRIGERWMLEGVTIVDPATTWIGADVTLAEDVTLLPGTALQGATSVAAGATIGPDTTLVDCEVGEDATVVRAHAELAVIGAQASVGPFAYLRPGTQLAARSKVGTFVETKNAQLGEGAKAPHLSYVGDATIGANANIGAGVIFANYDGLVKSHTDVGEASFVGSDSVLVAPVRVADGAYVAAGSTVTADVDPGQLAVSRARQRNIDGWVQRKRAGTKTAAAAERALGRPADPEQT